MKSIRSKILFVVIINILIAIILQNYFTFQQLMKMIDQTVSSTLDVVTSKTETQISDLNEKYLESLRSIAKLPFYTDENVSLEEKCGQLINLAFSNPETYIMVAFYDKNGYTIYGDGTKVDFSDLDYVQAAINGKEFITDPMIWGVEDMEGRAEDGSSMQDLDTETQILVCYAVPVFNADGAVVGAIVAIVNGEGFKTLVKDIDVGIGHHPTLIARTTEHLFGIAKNEGETFIDNAALFNSPEFAAKKKDLLAGNTSREIITYPGTKEKIIAGYNTIPNTTWSILYAVPYDFYFKPVKHMMNFTIISILITLALSTIIIILFVAVLVRPLKSVSTAINDIASGNADLTKRIEVKTKDEIGHVVIGFNSFTEKLQGIISKIKQSENTLEATGHAMDASTQETSASIEEVIANIESVHQQINTQSQSVQETAGAVNQIASNIASLERLIENQANGVTGASTAVEEMMGNIESVNRSVDRMAASFDKLMTDTQNGSSKQEDVSMKVEQIVTQSEMLQEANQVISNIAEQTNLLAMNAAIEAAHAGDAGKGFSVVADEIRKLSETSTAQSKTIGNQLNGIKESIAQVVIASNESNKAFVSVTNAIKETDEVVRLIKAAMEEQTIGSQQINEALHQMNDSTVEVRTASHEMAEGNKQILDEVKNLQDSTLVMKQSMDEMSVGAKRINETGSSLNEISGKLKESIDEISVQINQFKV